MKKTFIVAEVENKTNPELSSEGVKAVLSLLPSMDAEALDAISELVYGVLPHIDSEIYRIFIDLKADDTYVVFENRRLILRTSDVSKVLDLFAKSADTEGSSAPSSLPSYRSRP